MATGRRHANRAAALAAALTVLFFILPAGADDKAQPAGGFTSVWRVSAEGGKATLYLAGSIHLLRDQDHPLPAPFEVAFQACDELVLEIVSADSEDAEMESLQRGMYGGKGMISEDLSPAAYAKLGDFLEGSGLPREAMDGFRPWMASMMISLTEMMKLGGKPELGADAYFEDRAVQEGKPISGLETSEFQIGLFAKLGRTQQEAMLSATLRDMADIGTEFPRMVKAWREGDDETLNAIMHDSLDELPGLRESILDKRNARWVEKFDKMLAGDRTLMVVVGAGHLVGDAGVVALLKAKGYRVERVRDAKPRPAEKAGRFIEL